MHYDSCFNWQAADALRELLQLAGCKPRHSHKLIQIIFMKVQQRLPELGRAYRRTACCWGVHPFTNDQVIVSMPRQEFNDLVTRTFLKERKRSVIVMLCGTSGSGKSTLAYLLASRLGINTVISTDTIRHYLRSFATPEEDPLIWASTYEAGNALPESLPSCRQASNALPEPLPSSRQAGNALPESLPSCRQASNALPESLPSSCQASNALPESLPSSRQAGNALPKSSAAAHSAHKRCLAGFKAQCAPVVEQLDRLITGFEERRQSVVCEGVHLSINSVVKLM
eukprot:gene1904-33318_t